MEKIRKARAYLEGLKDAYNSMAAKNESVLVQSAISMKLRGAMEIYNLLTDEECCIEEDKYGEIELNFYKKEGDDETDETGLTEIVNVNGYDIAYNIYGRGEYTVFYNGEDLWFDDVKDAIKFIDSLFEEEE